MRPRYNHAYMGAADMKKPFSCLIGIVLLFSCGGKQPQIDKKIEDGVEVVINHLKPYSLPGVRSTLKLEEILSIDTEADEVLKTGLTSIESFCLDREGNVYFIARQSPGNFIYKFDASGKFLASFGRRGQGPGEFDWGGDILIDEENRVIAKDMTAQKFFIFNGDGVLLDEVKIGKNLNIEEYLGKKKYLTYWWEEAPEKPVLRNHYCISNDTLSENQEFYRFEFDDRSRASHYRPRRHTLILGASGTNIFIGDSTGGYEIFVFDFSGKLLRKISKSFLPVAFPEEYKALLKKSWARYPAGQDLIKKTDFPAHLPPFQYLFADDQGRLYVMTNEREGERKYWYDIFSSEGAFIGRFLFDNYSVVEKYYTEPVKAVVREDRLYSLREKDNGFRVLSVYKMIWN
jgi:hypothetical protein